MKTTHLLSLGALALAFALPAAAHNVVYTTELLSEPGVDESTATGFARVTLDMDDFTMRVEANLSGLTAPSTGSHIHCCTPVSNAGVSPVAVDFPGFPLNVTSGTYDHTFDLTLAASLRDSFFDRQGGTASGALAALEQGMNSGKAYFNIHSEKFIGGELRGNFNAPAVPEPHSGLLLLMGLAGVGAVVQRRRAN